MTEPRFIVFEGVDGCGKSTQAALLATRLDALLTREPGGTDLGGVIRNELLHAGHVSPRAEALLMAADRAHHVATLIRPTLAAGRHVVSDRYYGSSVAYQGFGRELGAGTIEELSLWATEGLRADVVVWIDVDRATSRGRVAASPDRFEGEDEQFWSRVADGFVAQHAAHPALWERVDGNGTVEDVADRVWAVVARRFGWGQ